MSIQPAPVLLFFVLPRKRISVLGVRQTSVLSSIFSFLFLAFIRQSTERPNALRCRLCISEKRQKNKYRLRILRRAPRASGTNTPHRSRDRDCALPHNSRDRKLRPSRFGRAESLLIRAMAALSPAVRANPRRKESTRCAEPNCRSVTLSGKTGGNPVS